MTNEETIHTTIIRLFTGEASREEKELIKQWLDESDENRKLYKDLKEIWLQSGEKTNSDQYDLEGAIRKFKLVVEQERQTSKRKSRFIQVLKYAAIILLLLGLPFSYFLGNKMLGVNDTITTITCAAGDKTTVILPDSSVVWMNSGSKLSFSNNFKKGIRQVYLDGEAYFSVQKDKNNPFKVNALDIEIEVLGTEFNLKAYGDDKQISATLVEGSIKMKSDLQQVDIKPNQKVIFDKEHQKMKLYKLSDTAMETFWKEGRLAFSNESLGSLELKLERWFDVDIIFEDEAVKNIRFTGKLERESILEVVSYFGYSSQLGYRINENTITFYSK